MSIETEFESTITNVQNAYQGLDNLGATIPQNKTIENIKNCLDEIYNNLPKTAYAEGSNITLSNTLKGKLDFENDIVGYGDTQQDTTQGKQLFQMPSTQTLTDVTLTQNSDGSLDIVGTAGANRDFSTDFIPLSNTGLTLGGSYYLSVGTTFSGVSIQIVGYNSSNAWVATSSMQSTTQGQAITLFSDSSITKIKFILRVYSGTTINQKNIKIMLNTGSSRADFEKFTGGQASPNPAFPQDIEVVRGKNRFNSEIEVGAFNNDGLNSNANNRLRSKAYIQVAPNTTYTLSWATTKNARCDVIEYAKNDFTTAQIKRVNNSYVTSPLTFTTSSTTNYIRLYIASTGDSTTSITDISNIQLEKGSTATSYLPYNTLEVKVENKNLFDKDSATIGKSFDGNNGNVINNENIAISDYISVVSSNTYCLSNFASATFYLIIIEYNSSKEIVNIKTNTTSQTSVSHTMKESTKYVRFNMAKTNINLVQLEKGSTATTYVEHQEQLQTISLGNIELCKIGNYVDTIEYDVDEDKVYKNEKIGKIVYTGASSESWNFVSVSESKKRNYITVDDIITSIQDSEISPIKCNYFISGSYSDGASPSGSINIITGRSGIAQINIFHNIADSNANFKTWLSTHNTEVRYVLATPTKTEITGTLKDQIKALYYSHSFTGTTIIEINGQLPLIIKVRALKGE